MKTITNSLTVNSSFIINALRNCGYNNYTAIADIIDNSIEPEVGSTFVDVSFTTEGVGRSKKIREIIISDNGCGMNLETLQQAVALGSETGKSGDKNLGMYGAGMKTASFSLGRTLTVYTKTADSNLYVATIDLNDAITNGGEITVITDEKESSSPDNLMFLSKTGTDHGTVVRISNLDRISNYDLYSFSNTLSRQISEIYNKYIYRNSIRFFVNGNVVRFVDLIGDKIGQNVNLLLDETFVFKGNKIRVKGWNIPIFADCENSNGKDFIDRSTANQGFYLYRQNRLVGRGLTLGMTSKRTALNGFRCEVFFDGNADYLFHSSFMKMVSEKTRDMMDSEFHDKLLRLVSPVWNQIERAYRKEKNDERMSDKKSQEILDKAVDSQNMNSLLRGKRMPNENKKENEKKGPGRPRKNENRIQQRSPRVNKWLDGIRERPLGETENFIVIEADNNKRYIVINMDHPFYEKIYSQSDDNVKFNLAKFFSCYEIARQCVNYYGDCSIRDLVDEYDKVVSYETKKSLKDQEY